MIRKKECWHLRKQVDRYYVSLINMLDKQRYDDYKEIAKTYPSYAFPEIMGGFRKNYGIWEIMVYDDGEERWVEQLRFKYKHQALKKYEELIEKHGSVRDNNGTEE